MANARHLVDRAHASVKALYDRCERYETALREIAKLPRTHDGDKDEREQNDMEDAFSNGLDVGRYDGYGVAARMAKDALGVPSG